MGNPETSRHQSDDRIHEPKGARLDVNPVDPVSVIGQADYHFVYFLISLMHCCFPFYPKKVKVSPIKI
jgi:hypothetical protein